MPGDPSGGGTMVIPSIRIQRPRTSPANTSRLTANHAAGRHDEAGIGGGAPDEHDIELLEYEWPDLPPLPTIKDAITRSRVSHGISYLLPVDKGRNSINNRFRTDLRAMFQEPYASDDLQYDDNRVRLSSKVHFVSNTGDSKWTRKHLASIPVNLNADSERMRRLYAHSAPTNGVSSRRMGIDPHKLRTRSNLYLPLKAAVPPELVKLRKEVEAIIKTVREDDEEYDEEQLLKESNALQTSQTAAGLQRPTAAKRVSMHPDAVHPDPDQQLGPHGPSAAAEGGGLLSTMGGGMVSTLGTHALTSKLQNLHVTPERFNSYEDLKNAKPPKPQIPDTLKSQFLDDKQNQDIWEWLHHGEEMTDFDFFLSVCG